MGARRLGCLPRPSKPGARHACLLCYCITIPAASNMELAALPSLGCFDRQRLQLSMATWTFDSEDSDGLRPAGDSTILHSHEAMMAWTGLDGRLEWQQHPEAVPPKCRHPMRSWQLFIMEGGRNAGSKVGYKCGGWLLPSLHGPTHSGVLFQ